MNNNKNSDKDKLDFDFESFQDESSSNNGNMEIPKTLNKQLAITVMSIALLGYYYFNDFSKTKSHKEELEPKQYVISAQHPQDQAVQETDNIPSVHEHPATPQEELKSTDQALPIQNQTESLNSETIKHDDTDSEQHVISDSVHGAYETEGVHQAPASIESDIEKPYSNTEHYDGLAKVSYDDYVYVAENQVQDLSIPIESYEFSVLGDNQEEDADFIENEAALDSNLEHKTQTDEANNDPHLPAITQQSENIAFNSVDILKDAPDLIMIEKSDSVIYAQYAIDATISQHMTVSLDSQDSHEEGVAGKKDHLVEDGAPTISKDNLSDCDDRHDTTSAPKKAPIDQSKDISSAPSKDVQAADMKAVSFENENNVQAGKETKSSSSGTDTVQKDKAVEQSKDISSVPSKDVQAADVKAVSLESENNVQAGKETKLSSSGTDTVQKDKAVEQSRGQIAQQPSQDGRMSTPEAHDSSMQSTASINHYNRLDMHFAALNAQNSEVQKLMQRVESAIKEVERKDAISAAQIAEMQKEKSASSSNKQETQSAIKSQSDSEKDAYEHLNKQLLQHQSDTQKMMESQAAKMDKMNKNMQDLSQKQTKEMNDRLSQIQADQQRVLKDLQAIISKHQENEKRLEKIESYIAQDLESLSQIDKVKINLTPEYHVHAIIPGRAWIRNHQNVIISVTEGQEIPDLGKIVTIDSKQGIIILSNGQVLRY